MTSKWYYRDIIINGGNILAIAKPGQDAGLDSESKTIVNGGTIIATGDMYDEIKSTSTQNFMVFNFSSSVSENTLMTLLDEDENTIFSYLTDRTYTNLVYSSKDLSGTYYLYKDGQVSGESENGVYKNVTNYSKGTQMGYSSLGSNMMGGPGGMGGQPLGNGPQNMGGQYSNSNIASNKDFTVSGISNLYSGVATYSE